MSFMRPERTKYRSKLQRQLVRFFGDTRVDIAIGVLVLLSVTLTLVEFWLSATAPEDHHVSISILVVVNDLITAVFVFELVARFWASGSGKGFLREYWIDIVAVLPLFRVFRTARAIRLLRLVRMLRVFGVATRLASHFPDIFRRGAMEYLVVCGLLIVTVIFGTGALMTFEGSHRLASSLARKTVGTPSNASSVGEPLTVGAGESFTFERSFWFSLFSLLAGEPIPMPPRTVGGRIVTVFLMFMGMTIFAMFTGTVSAFMVERLRTEGRFVDWEQLENHVIVCGWNRKAEIIVQELRNSPEHRDVPIVVISEFDGSPPQTNMRRMFFLSDDFTKVPVLEKAGIHRATTCVVLSDTQHRSEQDADARTILAALTVEKLNPRIYTCAELLEQSYASHLEMGHVNDYVISGEHSAYALAQAAVNQGMMGVIGELLTRGQGNEFHRVAVPDAWVGKEFTDVLHTAKTSHGAILIGVKPADGQISINPTKHRFSQGDEAVMIAPTDLDV